MKFTSIVVALIAVTPTSSTLCGASPFQSLLRMDNLPNTDSEAVPMAITHEGAEAEVSFRPLPSLPTHTEGPHLPQSLTPDQINALRAQIHAFKVANRGKPVRKHIREAIHVPNRAIHDPEPPLHEPDANTRVVHSEVKIRNSLDPDTPVHGVVEQRPSEIVVSRQPVKEEVVEVEVVDSEKISKGSNT